MILGIHILGPKVSVLAFINSSRTRVATLVFLVTGNGSIVIQGGEEKKVKVGKFVEGLGDTLLGAGRTLLGVFERSGSQRDESLCMVLFLPG